MADFVGEIKYRLPGDKLIQFFQHDQCQPFRVISLTPMENTLTVFTDGSGKTGIAGVCWYEHESWKKFITKGYSSTQRA